MCAMFVQALSVCVVCGLVFMCTMVGVCMGVFWVKKDVGDKVC